MSVVTSIATLCKWVEDNIAGELNLKVPDDSEMGYRYKHQLKHPEVFAFYTPTSDKTQKPVVPSITITPESGTDTPTENVRKIGIQMEIKVWDPGTHPEDWYNIPEDQRPPEYKKNSKGWMDAFNALDVALRKLENAEIAGNCRVCMEDGIEWGPSGDEEGFISLYPYWIVWINFTIEEDIVRKQDYLEELL